MEVAMPANCLSAICEASGADVSWATARPPRGGGGGGGGGGQSLRHAFNAQCYTPAAKMRLWES